MMSFILQMWIKGVCSGGNQLTALRHASQEASAMHIARWNACVRGSEIRYCSYGALAHLRELSCEVGSAMMRFEHV